MFTAPCSRLPLITLGVALITAGCGGAPATIKGVTASDAPVQWTTTVYADHPLVGQIWSTTQTRFVTADELSAAVSKASPLLIGERHDHPDHHQIQARIISQLKSGAIVGFEMLDEDDVKVLKDAVDAPSLRKLTAWDKSGWPDFDLYAPVVEAVYTQGHTPRAVHPARRRLRALMMGPSSQKSAPTSQASALSVKGLATLKADIDRSHCGYASPAVVDAMVKAQEFKDRWMSEKLSAGEPDAQRVVIAGNGHVRKDYGLPNHLPKTTVSVGILEVKETITTPAGYHPDRYDYIWFTPRLDTLNPCDKYRKALEAMKKAHETRSQRKAHERRGQKKGPEKRGQTPD